MPRWGKMQGVTLTELMVTIAVLAIGSALAYPSFNGLIRSHRVSSGTNELVAAFNLARTEALRSRVGAGVCPSADGNACAGGNWNSGVLVFTDTDGNKAWSAGDIAVRHIESAGNLALLAAPAADELGDGPVGLIRQVAFDRSGRVRTATEITLKPEACTAGEKLQRRVVINRSGQIRTLREECE